MLSGMGFILIKSALAHTTTTEFPHPHHYCGTFWGLGNQTPEYNNSTERCPLVHNYILEFVGIG